MSNSTAAAGARLRRFAYRVAGPRDVVINIAINGTIAWWLYGNRAEVPLTGSGSVFGMLLPMTFLESALTSFFGVLNGVVFRLKDGSAPGLSRRKGLFHAIRRGLIHGVAAGAAAMVVQFLVGETFPSVMLSPAATIMLIGLTSGVLAYGMHAPAVAAARHV